MEIKVSVVVTVKNDEAGIAGLRKALEHQTIKPDEVIVIRAEEYENCSRGKGRNIGVKAARNEVIAVTDAGCRPRPDWLYKLYKCYKSYKNNIGVYKVRPWAKPRSDLSRFVVAGWYRVKAKTELQKVMAHFLAPAGSIKDCPWRTPKTVLSGGFLPASRSIMFTKAAWSAVGGYPEKAASGAEDLEFARRLATHPKVKMIYCPQALVDWQPPATLTDFFRDIVKHTRGNVEVGYRPHLWRNLTVVGRWVAIGVWPWLGVGYLVIILLKVRRFRSVYVDRRIGTLAWLPIVQVVADAGVVYGLILGIWGRITPWATET